MKHKIDLYHIVIRSHSGRHLLLEADRYQKFYLIINAPAGMEHLIGKRIRKDMVSYRTRSYIEANQWMRRQECTEMK